MITAGDVTVVVPSFGRHEVLADTLESVVALDPAPGGVIVVDQTPVHPPAVEARLRTLREQHRVRFVRLARPSQPAAMNVGLMKARTDYVLFLDDDLIPCTGLIGAHAEALDGLRRSGLEGSCVVGQIVQPWQTVINYEDAIQLWGPYPSFPFNSRTRRFIAEASAGNLCVHRRRAISLGGFDENFKGAAHKCDTEFAWRLLRSGGRVLFEPRASIRHLKVPTGGTRSYGNYLRTWRPHYPVGCYYLALRLGFPHAVTKVSFLAIRCFTTRHHLRRPWWIPVTLVSNALALGWAVVLWSRRPKFIARDATATVRARAAPLGDPERAFSEAVGSLRPSA